MSKLRLIAKNRLLFLLFIIVIALFLAVNITPANAQLIDPDDVPAGISIGSDDVAPPDDVENLEADPFDESVLLKWDVATDDTEVTGYKIYSGPDPVTSESGEYSNDSIDAGDVIEFLVTGLDNEETIYFAVTAYDAEGNESENYSTEVNATPDATFGSAPELFMAADEEAPTVSDAQAIDNETVRVIFSEAVVLPADESESAFSIVNNLTSETLSVTQVSMDPDDVLGRSVLLSTDAHDAGDEYILTVGIQLEDTAGNPIVSGTSDTAAFIGSSVEPGSDLTGDLPEDDFEAPTVVSAESLGENSMQIVFSESVILNTDPETNFFIAEEDDANNTLDIDSVERDSGGSIVTIETSDQDSISYIVIVSNVMDEAGNEIDDSANSASFEGNPQTVEEEETKVLEELVSEVKDFLAEIVRDIVVKLTWEMIDDPRIVDQILYKSTDGGSNYDNGTSLGTEREEVELTGLTPGLEYFFKLTTMDDEGNESDGVETSIMLPETGIGIGLLFGASLGLSALRNRKKKK